jgi:hypothetical protein
MQIISTSESQGTVSINGTTIVFNVGTVNIDQMVTLKIVVRAKPSDIPPATIVNTATMSYSGGLSRAASATIRLTVGNLPSTGEHPDMPQSLWSVLIATVIGIGAIGLYRSVRIVSKSNQRPRT